MLGGEASGWLGTTARYQVDFSPGLALSNPPTPPAAANNEDPTYANRIHALFQTPETANIWKQADFTINGPLKDEATGLAGTGATATATGVITAKSAGTSLTGGAMKELSGAFTELFGIIEYGKVMLKIGYNMVAGCQ